jgi:hypothetical protein
VYYECGEGCGGCEYEGAWATGRLANSIKRKPNQPHRKHKPIMDFCQKDVVFAILSGKIHV